MAEKYISVDDAVAIIEEKQRELCPVCRHGRSYASDREKYDELQEMIEEMNSLDPADVRPVKRGEWVDGNRTAWKCSACGYGVFAYNTTNFCPNCGADMRQEPPEREVEA